MPDYIPVPVAAAKEISDRYAKSVVIICSWDNKHGLLHTCTYGELPHEKDWAAQGGEIAARALGADFTSKIVFEDLRKDHKIEFFRRMLMEKFSSKLSMEEISGFAHELAGSQ